MLIFQMLPLFFFLAFFMVLPVPDPVLAAQSNTFTPVAPIYSLINEDDPDGSNVSQTSHENIANQLRLPQITKDDLILHARRTVKRLKPLFFPYM